MEKIETLWNALRQVRTLEFVAHSRSDTGWTGKGTGSVIAESPTLESIVFHESGMWHPTVGKNIEFRNIYRWLRSGDTVRLEHLRFGEEHAVYLFDLTPDSNTVWSSVAPHLCRQDEYVALLQIQESTISLHWQITGPAKNEAILYRYGATANTA